MARSPKRSGKATAGRSRKKTKPGRLRLHANVEPLPFDLCGPFVRLPNGSLLTVDDRQLLISRDRGQSWKPRPMFEYGRRKKEYKFSDERVLLRTRDGSIIFSFVNVNEANWLWRNELHDTLPGTRSPNYVTRSTDGGKTWSDPHLLHEDWTGDLRSIIQTRSGRIVISSMKMLRDPGRHGVLTYTSDDDGVTWRASNLIDIGGCGHHAGCVEAAIEELSDDRVLMLLRTNLGVFWRAISHDGGASWRNLQPSNIDASSAPGQLKQLASGRLMLVWNRVRPTDPKRPIPMRGGDGIWSEISASNHREELSIAFSEDDGDTWSEPVVIARQHDGWLSYPRVLEIRSGELWITTMQGKVRVKLNERDFV